MKRKKKAVEKSPHKARDKVLIVVAAVILGALFLHSKPANAGILDFFSKVYDTPVEERFVDTVSDVEAAAFEALFEETITEIRDELHADAEFHAQQVDCLVKAIYFEAAKEPQIGKVWVYDVINNRVKNQYRGKTTHCEVIYDYKQFSFANLTKDRVPDNNRYLKESRRIVEELYGNPDHRDITCGATHYLNIEMSTDLSWYNSAIAGTSPEGLTVLAKVGNHTFLGPEDGCH